MPRAAAAFSRSRAFHFAMDAAIESLFRSALSSSIHWGTASGYAAVGRYHRSSLVGNMLNPNGFTRGSTKYGW